MTGHRTLRDIRHRLDELNGFLKGTERDSSAEADAERERLTVAWQAIGKRNLREARRRLSA